LLQYLPLLARDSEQVSLAIGSLAALAKKGPVKTSEAALFGLADLLPLLAHASRMRIVEECLAIWDDLPVLFLPLTQRQRLYHVRTLLTHVAHYAG
jgi:hypothetical protein